MFFFTECLVLTSLPSCNMLSNRSALAETVVCVGAFLWKWNTCVIWWPQKKNATNNLTYTFLVNDQRDAQFFIMYLFLYLTLYTFRAHFSHHQERELVRPAQDTVTDTEWQLPEVVLTQFLSHDDEHNVAETCRVKYKNKYMIKNCASCWSFTKNHSILHGQQNVKFCHTQFIY
jgi:hypothetical protein